MTKTEFEKKYLGKKVEIKIHHNDDIFCPEDWERTWLDWFGWRN